MDGGSNELNYSLENLSRSLFRGYDRKATEQLFARLNTSYKNLQIERRRLAGQLEELQQAMAERGKGQERLGGELEQLQAKLEASEERERSLTGRLERAKSFMDEEVEKVRAEAARELERVRADAERDLEFARTELAGYQKREELVKDMLEATRRSVESIKDEARADAERILKKARRRETKIVGDARREHERLNAERERLAATAAELRDDLSAVLITTLEQLTPNSKAGPPDESASKPAPGVEAPEASPGSETPAANETEAPLQADNGAAGLDEPPKGRTTPRRTPRS